MSDGQVLPTPHKTGLWLFVASALTSVLLESDYSASISHLIARTRNSYEDSGCWTNCFDLTRRKSPSVYAFVARLPENHTAVRKKRLFERLPSIRRRASRAMLSQCRF